MEHLTQFQGGEINLDATLDCGQAFRWQRDGEWVCGVIGARVVWVRQVKGGVEWKCSPATQDGTFLAHYLALDDPLKEIIASFPDDPHLREAVKRYYGLRILRQEPWETLASFIASSTKQIVQIKQIVGNLCERFGEEILIDWGARAPRAPFPAPSRETSEAARPLEATTATDEASVAAREGACAPRIYAFPTPNKIASATHAQLWDCKLGFRAKYLLATARMIDAGKLDLAAVAKMKTAEAREELMKCAGVGEKIANCTLLFGFGRYDACPIDVWVERALRQLYFRKKRTITAKKLKEFSENYFGPNAGYAQQYLFHYVRMNPEVLAS